MRLKYFITALILTGSSAVALSNDISVHQRIAASNGNAVEIGSAEAEKTVEVLPKTGAFKDINQKAFLSFGVDHNYEGYLEEDMNVRVVVHVTPYDKNDVAQTAFDQSLEIEYKPFSFISYQDKDQYIFEEAYKFEFRIDSVFINGVSDTLLPANMYVDGDITIDRTYEFASSVNTVITPDDSVIYLNCDTLADELEIRWNTLLGAEEYQLEWVFVNDYTATENAYSATGKTYNFRNNSTRISTAETFYRIPLVFDHGYVLYRVRAIGRDTADLDKRIFGTWSYDQDGLITDAAVIKYHNTVPHEKEKNWQLTTTFAEEGKKKEVISYFDGSLRNRQSVTRINSDNNTIVGETIYDHQGRPAVNILPVPVQTPTCDSSGNEEISALQFYPNFNLNDSAQAYSRHDFDLDDSASWSVSAGSLNDSTGASNYYSPSNPNKTAHQAYVPQANGYPFTQVEYTPDNTGRIKRQSGVGENFKLGSGKETQYFYGKPMQIKLNRLFGSEVGYASHYKKNLVIDPNGQISVSYLDQEGRVVATSLAGEVPDNLIALTSEENASVDLTADLFEKDPNGNSLTNAIGPDGKSIVYNQELLVSTASDYEFIYSIDSDTLYDSCLVDTICFHCVYDLTFMITDACGDTIPSDTIVTDTTIGYFTTDSLGTIQFNTECQTPSGVSYSDTLLVSLTPGNYTISKILTLREDAIDYYVEAFLDSANNECVKTLYDFQQDFLALVDTSSCYVDCDSCESQLGTRDDFVSQGLGTALEYDIMLEECQAPCQDIDPCDVARQMMLVDMMPAGQYGTYYDAQGNIDVSSYNLSIYSSNNMLSATNALWSNPYLEKNGNTYDYFIDELGDSAKVILQSDGSGGYVPSVTSALLVHTNGNGDFYTYPDNLANVTDFIDLFQESWAQSLLYYHPEYCYYKTCLEYHEEDSDENTSNTFDNLLLNTETFDAAINAGIIKSNYAALSNPDDRLEDLFTVSTSHAYDPFVTSGNFGAYASALETKYDTYVSGSPSYSMIEMAAATVRCGTVSGLGGSCTDFGKDIAGYTAAENDSIRDLEWQTFKAMYQGEKRTQQNGYAHEDAIANKCYNGCIGQVPFHIHANGFYGSPGNGWLNNAFYDNDQPCSVSNYHLYKTKAKRFPDTEDIPGYNSNASNQTNYNTASSESFMQTGVCPTATNLEQFLTELSAHDTLTDNHQLIGAYGTWAGLYYSIYGFDNPAPQVYWDTLSSDLTLDVTLLDSTTSDTLCKMGLDATGVLTDWDDVQAFTNINPTGFDGDYYNFTVIVEHDSSGTTLYDTIPGYTCMNIECCLFETPCSANQLAADLQNLMSALASDDELQSISFAYGLDNDYANTESLVINNHVSGSHSTLKWDYNSSDDIYEIRSANDTLCLEITGKTPSSFSNYTDIWYFDNFLSATEHYFTVEGYDSTGTLLVTLEGQAFVKTATDTIPVSLGDCDLKSIQCATVAHGIREDLENLLHESLLANPFSSNINFYNSIYITDNFSDAFGFNAAESSSSEDTITVDSVFYDSLHIALTPSGEGRTDTLCNLYLSISSDTAQHLQFEDLTNLGPLVATGTPGFDGNFYDFYMLADFSYMIGETIYTASDTVWGSSACLSLQNCDLCDSVVSPPDTIIYPNEDAVLMTQSQSKDCESDHGTYLQAITTYNTYVTNNSLNWPEADTTYTQSEMTFLNYCGCVDRFDKYVSSLTDGFGEDPDSADIVPYLDLAAHCPKPPCQPYIPVTDTIENIYVDYVNPCVEDLMNTAMLNAEIAYQNYLDSMASIAADQYQTHCIGAVENLNASFSDKEYHFTLYYYDQAGNLVKTVPPEGVQLLDDLTADGDSLSQLIANDRFYGTHSIYTSHRLATTYTYNSLNQLVKQSLPDHNKMDVFDMSLSSGLDNGMTIESVQFVNSARGYLAGWKIEGNDTLGLAYKSDDGGKTWQRLRNTVAEDLNKVNSFNDVAYAVGNRGVLLKSSDAGMSWNMIDLYGLNVTEDLNDVALSSTTSGLIVGDGGRLISLQSSGLSSISPTVTNASYPINSDDDVLSVKRIGTTYYISVWHTPASGDGFGLMYKSADTTGNHWIPLIDVQGPGYNDIDFVDANTAYAVGDQGSVYQTIDAGDNWYVVDNYLTDNLSKVFFMDANNGIVLADSLASYGKLMATNDGGNTWYRLNTYGQYYSNFHVYYEDGSYGAKLALVGPDAAVARLIMQNNTGFGVIPLDDISASVDFTGVWAKESNNKLFLMAAGNAANIYFTRDAEASVTPWSSDNVGVSNIVEIKADSVSAVFTGTAMDNNGKLYGFTLDADPGTTSNTFTWGAFTTPTAGNQEFSALENDPDNSRLLAYNQQDNKLYTISPSGASLVTSASDNGVVTAGLASLDQYTAIAVDENGSGLVSGPTGYLTHASESAGSYTWSEQKTNIRPQAINDMALVENDQLWAVGERATLLRHDTTSNALYLQLAETKDNWNAIAYSGVDSSIVVGDSGAILRVYRSGGNFAFTNIASNTTSDLYDVVVDASTYTAYVAGEGNQTRMTSNNLNTATPSFSVMFGTALNNTGLSLFVGANSRINFGAGQSVVPTWQVFPHALTDLHFSNAQNGYVIGDHYTVRYTNDGGQTWQSVIPDNGFGSGVPELNTVWNTSAATAYVGGNDNYIATTNGTESTESGITLPGGYGAGIDFNDITFVDSDTAFMVGGDTDGQALISVDGGANWTSVSGAIGEVLHTVHGFTRNNTFIAGGENGQVAYFDGTSMLESGYQPVASFTGTINDIYFHDDITGYLVGDNGEIHRSINGSLNTNGLLSSINWLEKGTNDGGLLNQTTEGDKNINAIDFAERFNGFIGGSYASGSPDVYARLLNDESNEYSTYFWYDKLGRIVVSQNSRQFNADTVRYSYTRYDELGRVVEAGEKLENTTDTVFTSIFGEVINGHYNPNVINDTLLSAWIEAPSGRRQEVTHSYYDVAINALSDTLPSGFAQNNLRKRIATVMYEKVLDNDTTTYDHATHYSYDIHGNVETLIQDNRNSGIAAQRFKRMDYEYDLISGNVHKVAYQADSADAWYHKYDYDADNRILHAYTSIDDINYDMDAKYIYYDHGPLARVELGENNVQGMDYAYTLQGWLKAVNSDKLNPLNDIGHDGHLLDTTNVNGSFAVDAMGYSLSYYQGDYASIDTAVWQDTATRFLSATNHAAYMHDRKDLYNGNIGSMITTIAYETNINTPLEFGMDVRPQATAYRYDQLNRLSSAKAYNNFCSTNNKWIETHAYKGLYENRFTYEANGNILTQLRRDYRTKTIDSLNYEYARNAEGQLVQNRLYHVDDAVLPGDFSDDIDDMGTFEDNVNLINNGSNNYRYDDIGQLIQDSQEGIDTIIWRVDGKIKAIYRTASAGKSDKKSLTFDYDAMGNRIAKHVYSTDTADGGPDSWMKSVYYSRDAQGNVMSVYEYKEDPLTAAVNYTLTERDIYGSSRVGLHKESIEMIGATTDATNAYHRIGDKNYELSNHLGNVLATVSDKKINTYQLNILERFNTTADSTEFDQWELLGSATKNIDNGYLEVIPGAKGDGVKRFLKTRKGKAYEFSMDHGFPNSTDLTLIQIYDMVSGDTIHAIRRINSPSSKAYCADFIALSDSTEIYITANTSAFTFNFDNFYLRRRNLNDLRYHIDRFEDSTDICKWSYGGTVAQTLDTGWLKVEVDNQYEATGRWFTTVPGHTYNIDFDLDLGTCTEVEVRPEDFTNFPHTNLTGYSYTTGGHKSFWFVATGRTHRLRFHKLGNHGSTTHYFLDNVEIRDNNYYPYCEGVFATEFTESDPDDLADTVNWTAVNGASFELEDDKLQVSTDAIDEGIERVFVVNRGRPHKLKLFFASDFASASMLVRIYDANTGTYLARGSYTNGVPERPISFYPAADSIRIEIVATNASSFDWTVDNFELVERDYMPIVADFEPNPKSAEELTDWHVNLGYLTATPDEGRIKVETEYTNQTFARIFWCKPYHTYRVKFNMDKGNTAGVRARITTYTPSLSPSTLHNVTYTVDGDHEFTFSPPSTISRMVQLLFYKSGGNGTMQHYYLDDIIIEDITDTLFSPDHNDIIASSYPSIHSAVDYSPFGVQLDGRTYNLVADAVEAIEPDYRWDLMDADLSEDNGSGYDMTANGGALDTLDRCGNSKSAYYLDGVDDYLEITDQVAFTPGADDFSVSIWVKKLSATVSYAGNVAVSKWNTGGTPGTNEWSLGMSSGASGADPGGFSIESGSTSYRAEGLSPVNLNEWYHLVGVRDGDYIKYFINGELQSQTYVGTASVNDISGMDMYFGKRQNNGNGHMVLDDFAYFRRALSQSEVKSMFDHSSCNFEGGPAGCSYVYTGYDEVITETVTNHLDVSGVDDHVRAGGGNRNITNEVTLEAWIRADYVVSAAGTFFNKYGDVGGGNYRGYHLFYNGGRVRFAGVNGSDGYKSTAYSDTIADGLWHHVVGVVDSNDTWSLYLDGVLVDYTDYTLTTGDLTNPGVLQIGDGTFSNDDFNGEMKHASIWNRARTAQEVLNDYTSVHPTGTEANLMGYFPLDEGTGTTAYDLSSTGADGTFSGSPTWTTDTLVDTTYVPNDSVKVSGAVTYRYGFQGQEKDNELKGEGLSINYKYRMHDPRLGRFFAVDPLFREYPNLSSYHFVSNDPISGVEVDGRWWRKHRKTATGRNAATINSLYGPFKMVINDPAEIEGLDNLSMIPYAGLLSTANKYKAIYDDPSLEMSKFDYLSVVGGAYFKGTRKIIKSLTKLSKASRTALGISEKTFEVMGYVSSVDEQYREIAYETFTARTLADYEEVIDGKSYKIGYVNEDKSGYVDGFTINKDYYDAKFSEQHTKFSKEINGITDEEFEKKLDEEYPYRLVYMDRQDYINRKSKEAVEKHFYSRLELTKCSLKENVDKAIIKYLKSKTNSNNSTENE